MTAVDRIYSLYLTFAVVLKDGTVLNAASIGAVQIYSTANEFKPILKDKRVVTWSDENAEVTVTR